jgi:hypothetical protein
VVGGLVLIEARDLNEAIQVASLHPAARMDEELGWGIELRPIEEFPPCKPIRPTRDERPMSEDEAVRELVEGVYRSDSRRVLATLIRLLGDFDLAEEALHDAFTAALERWPREGPPANPRAWLVSAGRFKAIDTLFSSVLLSPVIAASASTSLSTSGLLMLSAMAIA